jgi:hypothetical protein
LGAHHKVTAWYIFYALFIANALDKLEKDTSPGSRKKQQQQEEQRQKQSPKPTCPESLFHTWMACLPHPDADTIV